MAKNNLNDELDKLYLFLFPPAEEGKDKAGSTDPLRKLLNKETHIFSMNATQLTTEIMQQGMRDSANKKREPHLKEEDKAMVTAFAKDLINAMIVLAEAQAKRAPDDYRVTWSSKNVGLKLTVSNVANPYNTLSKMRTAAGKKIEGRHQALFTAAKVKKGAGSLVQIGHDVSIAAAKGAALVNSLEAQRKQQGEVTPFMLDGLDITKDAIDQVQTFMAKHKINIEHYRDVKVVGGKLTDRIKVHSTAEGSDYNQIIKANKDSGSGIPEKEIGLAIKKLIKQIKKRANKFYKQMGAKERAKAKTSRSMLDDMTNIILSTPKMKKARKNKKITKVAPKVETPKSFNDKAKGKERKYKMKVKKDTNYLPLAAKKLGRRKAATESGDSIAPLYALLNAKLPRTVAENMGAPGLESRSGRFASSVRVTDVNRTAKGFPSIGYTYQKNPYQVFEMGVGHSSWATTARDPRTLIDASIREIAQQLAVGRFYTRRV